MSPSGSAELTRCLVTATEDCSDPADYSANNTFMLIGPMDAGDSAIVKVRVVPLTTSSFQFHFGAGAETLPTPTGTTTTGSRISPAIRRTR